VVERLVLPEPQCHGVEFASVLVDGDEAQAVVFARADGPGEVDPEP
jgi:hypothetical protein